MLLFETETSTTLTGVVIATIIVTILSTITILVMRSPIDTSIRTTLTKMPTWDFYLNFLCFCFHLFYLSSFIILILSLIILISPSDHTALKTNNSFCGKTIGKYKEQICFGIADIIICMYFVSPKDSSFFS